VAQNVFQQGRRRIGVTCSGEAMEIPVFVIVEVLPDLALGTVLIL
jgi:hypothetical protein